jgi:transposase-like protein
MNLIDVTRQFGTPEACNDFLESMRWPDGVECVHCGGNRVTKYVKKASTRQRLSTKTGQMETKTVPARILYVCLDCKKQFSVGDGTVFNDTHLSLDKWLLTVALMVNAKKGISSLQLRRDVKMARKTAWYLNHRIRKAMGLVEAADEEKLAGTVEADETYAGGKYDARRKRTKYDKEPLHGVVSRDGKARTCHMPRVALEGVVEKIKDKDNVSITADAIYADDSDLYGTVAGCIKKLIEPLPGETATGPEVELDGQPF